MTAQGWRKRKKVDGGKGDAPRDSANQEAYNAGWDRIFGNKDKEVNKDGIREDTPAMHKLQQQ